MMQRVGSLLSLFAGVALFGGTLSSGLASTPQAWAEMDAQSRVACAQASGFQESKVGAPIRFSDSIGIDVRVVTGDAAQPHPDAAPMTVVCAFDRRTGKALKKVRTVNWLWSFFGLPGRKGRELGSVQPAPSI